MATTFVQQGQSGNIALDKYKAEYEHTFKGITASAASGVVAIIADWTAIYGNLGTVHPDDPRAALVNVSASRSNLSMPKEWNVTAKWSSDAPDEDENTADPTDMSPRVSYSFQEIEKYYERDLALAPIENSANMPFMNPPARKLQCLVITVEVNKLAASFNLASIMAVANKVNLSTWNGAAAGYVLCKAPDAQQDFQKDIGKYFKIKYQFVVNPEETWQAHILDSGMCEKTGVDGAGNPIWRQIIDAKTGQAVANPVALDGGLRAAAGVFNYLDFTILDEIDFSTYFPWTL